MLPDVMGGFIICLLSCQKDLISNLLVERFWTGIELSKIRTFDISIINILMKWIDLEQVFTLTEVSSVIVSKF